MDKNPTEYWLRGPVAGVPPLLQPVAHALLQASMEVAAMLRDFPPEKLWVRPAGTASVGFHLQHMAGVLDRLFAYSRGQSLTPVQLEYLSKEGKEHNNISVAQLVDGVQQQVQHAVAHLKGVDTNTLTHVRYVGRKQVPSTVMGLLFHAAEHTMRHTGQLLVTVQVVKEL